MVHPYSQDLRERSLNLIKNGMSISHVSHSSYSNFHVIKPQSAVKWV